MGRQSIKAVILELWTTPTRNYHSTSVPASVELPIATMTTEPALIPFQWLHYDETDLLDFCMLLD